jgi:hypothetical protein
MCPDLASVSSQARPHVHVNYLISCFPDARTSSNSAAKGSFLPGLAQVSELAHCLMMFDACAMEPQLPDSHF